MAKVIQVYEGDGVKKHSVALGWTIRAVNAHPEEHHHNVLWYGFGRAGSSFEGDSTWGTLDEILPYRTRAEATQARKELKLQGKDREWRVSVQRWPS